MFFLIYPLRADVQEVYIKVIYLLPGYYEYALDVSVKLPPGIENNNLKPKRAGAGD
jgi:hypothetical protein